MEKVRDRRIDLSAMDRMNDLNEQLKKCGYKDHERELILVRLLLCFFSEQTGVFGKASFFTYLEEEEVRKLTPAARLNLFFSALGGVKPDELSGRFEELPYLSRTLFAESIPEKDMDEFFLLSVGTLRDLPWKDLSPAIFGAMFQEIMNQDDRREWGAFYTSEENIDKVIDPLFMDNLLEEREAARGSRKRLAAFHDKLASLTFLDPACGCGNFLIRIYTRLRWLEMDVIDELYDTRQRILDTSLYCHVTVNQLLGIEIEPYEAQIARVCLWLAERQLDLAAAERFGVDKVIPTMIAPIGIRQGNALTFDWSEFARREGLSYIVGNPPFVGARRMNADQKADMKMVFGRESGTGNLDYVCAWYRKAAEFMSGTRIRCAFVSTNSVSQGEQASILWRQMALRFDMQIDFAYRAFVWNNDIRGQAKVHCVIIGFSDRLNTTQGGQHVRMKRLYDAHGCRRVPCINGYLTAAPEVYVMTRRTPVADVPEMRFGSMANDQGNLILSPEERESLLAAYPESRELIRPFLGSQEFIGGMERYCLWLKDKDPSCWENNPEISARIRRVEEFRLASKREDTRKLAACPERFGEIRQPEEGSMILVPRVSSMRRRYIPIGFVPSEWIASDAVMIIPGADESLFAMLTSSLHMVWVKAIAGRLKSDYRYSASVVYNNFPFPDLTGEQRRALADCGRRILEIRSRYQGASLADLYGAGSMPEDLSRAHEELDALMLDYMGLAGKDEEEQLTELLMRLSALA